MSSYMKHRLFLMFAILCNVAFVSCSSIRQVGYIHNPLEVDGGNFFYSVTKENGELYLLMTVKSDNLTFTESPTLKLKNFNGNTISITGEKLTSLDEHGGIVINNVIVPYTETNTVARFKIENEQILFFYHGIQKIRLTTVPYIHEKTFKSDVIGFDLYNDLTKFEHQDDAF